MTGTERRQFEASRRNLWFAFTFVWVPLTSLDIVTTYIGLQGGYVELNPVVDTSSITSLVLPEIAKFLVGLASIAFGIHLKRRDLIVAAGPSYAKFRHLFVSKRRIGFLFIYVPIVFALARFGVVVNNVMWVVWDFGMLAAVDWVILSLFGLDLLTWNRLFFLVNTSVVMWPSMYLIHLATSRAARASGTQS